MGDVKEKEQPKAIFEYQPAGKNDDNNQEI